MSEKTVKEAAKKGWLSKLMKGSARRDEKWAERMRKRMQGEKEINAPKKKKY